MAEFEQVSRPVLFEHTDSDYPYWGKGTSLLVATAQSNYWVTAQHVLKNSGGRVDALRIFPTDWSRISLPFNEQYEIPSDNLDDDYKDILIVRVDLERFKKSGDAPLVAQDVDVGFLAPEQLAIGSELLIIGYPSESNWIDYDEQKIKSNRSLIKARYEGLGHSEHCHQLHFDTSLNISNFDGLSGSPVFVLQPRKLAGQDCLFPMLVGVLIRGTAESQIGYFISALVIKEMIRLAEINA